MFYMSPCSNTPDSNDQDYEPASAELADGKEKKKKSEKQTENTHDEDEGGPALALARDIDKQPGWALALQANLKSGLGEIRAKMDTGQQHLDVKLDRIVKQMEELKQGLENLREETNRKLESVNADIRGQRKDIEMLEERAGEVEEWSTEVQEILTVSLEHQRKLQQKVADLEGRSRRNNIRIWGLKEGVERDSTTDYVDKLIHKELGISEDIQLEIQRAHRALAPKAQLNKPPRAMIVNFLRFNIKENVLKTAWRTPLQVEGNRVTFDHDYAIEVAAKRREYAGLKKILKEKRIRFGDERVAGAEPWTRELDDTTETGGSDIDLIETVKYLGVYVTKSMDKLFETNYTKINQTIKADLGRWSTHVLDLSSRIEMVKMNILL
uniref:L1 transposable element RRM domain-containing protein n=1 Tax=Hippocampus comes TaxID=109280 RepID=A0A3Q3DZE8_HIPCM